jgi:hypothetical protein
MKKFESENVQLNSSAEDVFEYIGNLSNFGKFMPEQITNWQSTADTCSFTVQNMTTLSMKVRERVPFERIDIAADGKSPFDFSLQILLIPIRTDHCEAKVVFNADLNPVLNMLASKPLQNLVDLMAQNLEKLYA